VQSPPLGQLVVTPTFTHAHTCTHMHTCTHTHTHAHIQHNVTLNVLNYPKNVSFDEGVDRNEKIRSKFKSISK